MTQLVGILNLTPDSFSDGGAFDSAEQAVAAAVAMVGQGAAVIDVGAESTRPGATPLSPEQEWARLSPVLPSVCRALAGRAAVSLDTRHAATASRALEAGVAWINDVSGLADPAMLGVLAGNDCRVVAMHSLTIPADPSVVLPLDADPVRDVAIFAAALLKRTGLPRERLILDPGIGFGKTAEQSLALLRRVDELHEIGLELLIGHSRKSFLTRFTDAPAAGRDDATLAVSAFLAFKQVAFLRVHEVARHGEMLAILRALA